MQSRDLLGILNISFTWNEQFAIECYIIFQSDTTLEKWNNIYWTANHSILIIVCLRAECRLSYGILIWIPVSNINHSLAYNLCWTIYMNSILIVFFFNLSTWSICCTSITTKCKWCVICTLLIMIVVPSMFLFIVVVFVIEMHLL